MTATWPVLAVAAGDGRGWRRARLLEESEPDRLLPLGRVPARAHLQQPVNLPGGGGAAGDCPSSGTTWTRSWPRRRSRASATRLGAGRLLHGLAGHPRDSDPRYGIRYEFGIFDQLIRDGWQSRRPTSGWPSATRGDPPAGIASRCPRRHTKATRTTKALPRPLGSRAVVRGVAYDVPISLPNGTRTPSALEAEATGSFDFRGHQPGGLLGRRRPEGRLREITKSSYPNDEMMRGKAAPPRAAVLLRFLLAQDN